MQDLTQLQQTPQEPERPKPLQPGQPWYEQLSREGWRQIVLDSRLRLHVERNDHEAMQDLQDAIAALNAYDQSDIDAAQHVGELQNVQTTGAGRGTLPTGSNVQIGGWGDPVQGALGIAEVPIGMVANLGRIAKDIYLGRTDHAIEDLDRIPESMVQAGEGVMRGDPRAIGNAAGQVGMTLVPGALVSSEAGAPTVAGSAWSKLKNNPVSSWIRRPALRNELLEEQTALAGDRRAAVRGLTEQRAAQAGTKSKILEQQLGNAETRGEILGETLNRQQSIADQMAQRLELLKQEASRGGPTAENLNLRNEIARLDIALKQLRLEAMQSGRGGSAGGMFESPAAPELDPIPGTSGRGRLSPEGPLPPVPESYPPTISEMQRGQTKPTMVRPGNDPELPQTAHAGGAQRFPIFEENAPLPTGLDAALKELNRWFHPASIR